MKVPRMFRKLFVDFAPTRLMIRDGAYLKKNERKRSSGFLSTLRTILESITPTWLLEPIREDEIDLNDFELQKFRWVRFSEDLDGESVPENGYLLEVLYYGPKTIYYERATPHFGGIPQTESIERNGYDKFLFIAALSDRYIDIIKIARGTERGQANGSERVLTFSPKLIQALRAHHQFKKLQEYWEARGRILELVSADEMHRYEVVLRAFSIKEQIAHELSRLGVTHAGKSNVRPFKRAA